MERLTFYDERLVFCEFGSKIIPKSCLMTKTFFSQIGNWESDHQNTNQIQKIVENSFAEWNFLLFAMQYSYEGEVFTELKSYRTMSAELWIEFLQLISEMLGNPLYVNQVSIMAS